MFLTWYFKKHLIIFLCDHYISEDYICLDDSNRTWSEISLNVVLIKEYGRERVGLHRCLSISCQFMKQYQLSFLPARSSMELIPYWAPVQFIEGSSHYNGGIGEGKGQAASVKIPSSSPPRVVLLIKRQSGWLQVILGHKRSTLVVNVFQFSNSF